MTVIAIDFARVRASVVQRNSTGSIDIYRGKAGRKGIDACVSLAVVADILATIVATEVPSDLYVCQPSVGGMVGLDAQVSPQVAAKVVAVAERAGVSIRR